MEKTYLQGSVIDQVLADDGGGAQAGVSNLGGCCVHWLHRVKSKEKGRGSLDLSVTMKPGNQDRQEGRVVVCSVHTSSPAHASVPVEMRAVGTRQPCAGRSHKTLGSHYQCQINIKARLLSLRQLQPRTHASGRGPTEPPVPQQ